MSDSQRQNIERFLNDELPEDEAERLSQLIDSDPQVSRLFDEVALESVFRPLDDEAAEQHAPENPELESLIKRQLAQSRHAELWSLRTSKGNEPRALFDKTRRITATAVRSIRDEAGKHVAEHESPVTIERVQSQPTEFRLSGDWPAGFEPMGIKLSRLKIQERGPFEKTLRFQSLADEIANRPTPAVGGSPTTGAKEPAGTLAAATDAPEPMSSSDVTSKDRDRPTFNEPSFRVQCDLRRGTISVSAPIPAGRTTDFIVSEIQYQLHEGQAVKREALRLKTATSDPLWSRWAHPTFPDPDDCASPNLTVRFRSLRDSDLYLLTTSELEELFAEQDAMLLPASEIQPGSFEFSTDLNFERQVASASDVTWSLQMARKAGEGRDA